MSQSEGPVDIFDRQDFPEPRADEAGAAASERASRRAGRRKPWLFGLLGVVIGVGIAWVVFSQGNQPQMPADHPPIGAAAPTPTPISAEEMAELKARVDADPTDKDHRLIYGVALYSEGQYGPAEEQWSEAARLDPDDPGPWYNLGFLYLSLDPPAVDKAEEAWRTVVELVPGTSMADTVSQHLSRLDATLPDAASPSPEPPSPEPSPTRS